MFINDDFLLDTPQARTLFHEYAEGQPIIDYHSHLDPAAIADNRQFSNIAQLWLDGDHYKWRAMRTNGIPERLCSGDAPDREKYDAWAATVPRLLRNPLYHWTHLELRRPFGISGILFSPETADEVWKKTSSMLQSGGMGALDILKRMNVETVCTTDDPCDDLSAHRRHASSGDSVKLLPTFRPDKARAVHRGSAWREWVARLEQASGMEIRDLAAFREALASRHDFFARHGCKLSDHSLEAFDGESLSGEEAAVLFASALRGGDIASGDAARFSNYLMGYFAELDSAKNWVRQLHVGALRNPNGAALRDLGPDTGFDAIADFTYIAPLGRLLDRSAQQGTLPRTILYNLNPRDNAALAVLCGSFQDGVTAGKMQYGAAWWFLDQMDGMTRHLETLSQLGMLSRFVGMLTDSRSLLSYTRHEYFRRILCRVLGRDMAQGLVPDDMEMVGSMATDISYRNAKQYFNF
ncbi:glucuronate isomerase [Akkermansia muciniphila]|uniref:Uronate isomerase n=1 Tax=Akkermansia muciniphila TaxID=239935 RepID=A0A2N8HBS9_9BACT|nr:glucuronate isomerase [Akkermansia muciniphila]PNC17305.1 glucuronate isomerase [Akkermansia muciniphila]